MWYDPRITLSHNCLFNFVVGMRSSGKTFNSVNYALGKFLRTVDTERPSQLAYVRRYKPEIRATSLTFLNDIAARGYFDGHEYKLQGQTGKVDKIPFVHFFPLTTSAGLKSVAYPNIDLIVFDEFLAGKGVRYLPREVEIFLELYVTIARDRDVPVLFLSNAITQTNPYYLYFGIKPNGKEFQRIKTGDGPADILLHTWKDEERTELRRQSRFGNLVAGTEYGDYSIENEYWFDNDSFIEKRDPSSRVLFCYQYKNKKYSVWTALNKGKVFVDSVLYPSCAFNYVFSREDMQPNMLLASSFKGTYHFKLMTRALAMGSLYFDTIDAKNQWYEIAKLINLA